MGRARKRQRGQGTEVHQKEQGKECCEPLGPLYTQSRLDDLVRCADQVTNVACQLPVTTRGIGFIVSMITAKLRQQLPEELNKIPVAAIYRISLAQLQLKMCWTRNRQFLPINESPIDHLFENDYKPIKEKLSVEFYARNLSPVALVINSIGKIKYNNKHFYPVFYKELSPLNLRIDNLREYCEEMANPKTDSSKRVAGFELNSIPNAKWARLNNNDPKSVVLTNPDEIIPAGYLDDSEGLMHEDESSVCNFIDHLINYCTTHKLPEMWGEIDYKCNGDPGFLVSALVEPGKNLSLKDDLMSGNSSEFWSLERIPPDSWSLGVMALSGEVINQMDGTARSDIEGPRCFLNWRGISEFVL